MKLLRAKSPRGLLLKSSAVVLLATLLCAPLLYLLLPPMLGYPSSPAFYESGEHIILHLISSVALLLLALALGLLFRKSNRSLLQEPTVQGKAFFWVSFGLALILLLLYLCLPGAIMILYLLKFWLIDLLSIQPSLPDPFFDQFLSIYTVFGLLLCQMTIFWKRSRVFTQRTAAEDKGASDSYKTKPSPPEDKGTVHPS